jgi:hypothetical protein
VLAHWAAITLEAEHAVAVLEGALAKYGQPETVNADQGSQFTIEAESEAVLGKASCRPIREISCLPRDKSSIVCTSRAVFSSYSALFGCTI